MIERASWYAGTIRTVHALRYFATWLHPKVHASEIADTGPAILYQVIISPAFFVFTQHHEADIIAETMQKLHTPARSHHCITDLTERCK